MIIDYLLSKDGLRLDQVDVSLTGLRVTRDASGFVARSAEQITGTLRVSLTDLSAAIARPEIVDQMLGAVPGIARPQVAFANSDDGIWSGPVRAALAADTAVPQEVFDGVVGALAGWGWPAGRPSWVTWVPSRRRNALLQDLAARLAQAGRMELATPLQADGPGFQDDAATNAESAATALRRLSVTGEVPSGPVLLVDDSLRSGFTLTVAAALLRESGSGPVYPLALHRAF